MAAHKTFIQGLARKIQKICQYADTHGAIIRPLLTTEQNDLLTRIITDCISFTSLLNREQN